MSSIKHQASKIYNSGTEGYLGLEGEPEAPSNDAYSFGLKEELFSNRYFLKHRVWRNMKKVRRQYMRPPAKSKPYRETARDEGPHFS